VSTIEIYQIAVVQDALDYSVVGNTTVFDRLKT
jgi:hypothetical protein